MAEKSILIFGAGKIGRSFIGQLFGKAGYKLIFVDMDHSLVQELNKRNSYPVVIKGPDHEEILQIEKVSAIHASDEPRIIHAIGTTDLAAISVGKNGIPALTEVVAKGLLERERIFPGQVLDVILAENMRSAGNYIYERLREVLPASYPLDLRVGLVETSIGKMVPLMTASDLKDDSLQVFAEPYNTLILDRLGFKGEIPTIEELSLKDNIKAWVDRKAFIHNLGHASAAYCGHLKHPNATFMYEVLADPTVLGFTKKVMLESAQILRKVYPSEFPGESLSEHIHDLLNRFQNRNLGDTVYRVGCDLHRKLGPLDRFMGVVRVARETNQSCGTILEAMAMGFLFQARDEMGVMLTGDIEFHTLFNKNPDQTFKHVCGLNKDEEADAAITEQLEQHINRLRSRHLTT